MSTKYRLNAQVIADGLREIPNATATQAANCIDELLAEIVALKAGQEVEDKNLQFKPSTQEAKLLSRITHLESALTHISNPYLYIMEEIQGGKREIADMGVLVDVVRSASHFTQVADLALKGEPFLD